MRYPTQIILLIIAAASLQARIANNPGGPPGESFLLVTDRGHYITGEPVYFRIFPVDRSVPWSTVLYVELVTPQGQALGRSKVQAGPRGAAGMIRIPTGISSGTCYLRAYSRWMRNCGPVAFAYTSLQLYDPFQGTVLPVDTVNRSGRRPVSPATGEVNPVRVSVKEPFYGTRQKAEVELEWAGDGGFADLSVSVVPAGMTQGQKLYPSRCLKGEQERDEFLPETRGASLTGTAVDALSGDPVPYAMVYVSILDQDNEFYSNYSDSLGRFYLAFPDRTGEADLFVSTFHPEHPDLELLIDRDFSTRTLSMPSYPALRGDSLAEALNTLAVNAQVAEQYGMNRLPAVRPDTGGADSLLFYGIPPVTVRFDEFIRLPTLEEYFMEVIPQVTLRKTRGIPRFQVQGRHPDLAVYSPLVMIDGVAIFDMESLLEVSPRLIDRIEIVDAPYVRGSMTFGGIISLVTRSGDMGYIDLPSSGLLVSYQMPDPPRLADGPSPPGESHLPDVRNTVLWKPRLRIRSGRVHRLSMVTPDTRGAYEVIVRGVLPGGGMVESTARFRVE